MAAEAHPSAGLGWHRLRVALVVLTVFGLPLALMAIYLGTRELPVRPPFDAQPGGTLSGRVMDARATPLVGVPVEVQLYPRSGNRILHASARSGSEGAFSFDVPALDGCYLVTAGGDVWARDSREVSMTVDDAADLDFKLEPGCVLVMNLQRRGGHSVRGGRFTLTRGRKVLGQSIPAEMITGEFDGESFSMGGLRPGTWQLLLELEDGTISRSSAELSEGRTELALPQF